MCFLENPNRGFVNWIELNTWTPRKINVEEINARSEQINKTLIQHNYVYTSMESKSNQQPGH